MCFTISVRFGLNHVLVIPFKIVYIPWIIKACSKFHPPILSVFWKNIVNKNSNNTAYYGYEEVN